MPAPAPSTEPARCPWCGDDPLYVRYHDEEWGVPSRDETHLFEMLCLEGQQAGLSWITVLRKRDRYREVFCGFDAAELADRGDAIVERAVHDPGVIRHRGKLQAIVTNARAALRVQEEIGPLGEYLWSFVGGEPVVNRLVSLKEAPSVTDASTRMSKDLKKRGFAFVGPTTCYAFMQAVGMVNDHLVSCFCHPDAR